MHSHHISLATSKNGSVEKHIFRKWYYEVIRMMYPDIANVSGKRVLLKSDGGPGRTDLEYLSQSNLDGLIHAPGLPNGTKFQELDNVFDLIKATMENNRKKYLISPVSFMARKQKLGLAMLFSFFLVEQEHFMMVQLYSYQIATLHQ